MVPRNEIGISSTRKANTKFGSAACQYDHAELLEPQRSQLLRHACVAAYRI